MRSNKSKTAGEKRTLKKLRLKSSVTYSTPGAAHVALTAKGADSYGPIVMKRIGQVLHSQALLRSDGKQGAHFQVLAVKLWEDRPDDGFSAVCFDYNRGSYLYICDHRHRGGWMDLGVRDEAGSLGELCENGSSIHYRTAPEWYLTDAEWDAIVIGNPNPFSQSDAQWKKGAPK